MSQQSGLERWLRIQRTLIEKEQTLADHVEGYAAGRIDEATLQRASSRAAAHRALAAVVFDNLVAKLRGGV